MRLAFLVLSEILYLHTIGWIAIKLQITNVGLYHRMNCSFLCCSTTFLSRAIMRSMVMVYDQIPAEIPAKNGCRDCPAKSFSCFSKCPKIIYLCSSATAKEELVSCYYRDTGEGLGRSKGQQNNYVFSHLMWKTCLVTQWCAK